MSKENPEIGDVFVGWDGVRRKYVIIVVGLRMTMCSDMSGSQKNAEEIKIIVRGKEYVGNIKKGWDKFIQRTIAEHSASKPR